MGERWSDDLLATAATEMLRIYISSTYKDLIDERAAVKEAILGLGHFPVGMEEYGAADERPLDKCLADVRSSQAYVGIIAWRHGFCPNNGDKSITRLEYEAAEAKAIPRYIFILNDEAAWPRKFIPDEDQPRIKAFRQMLENDRLAGHFSDKNELARLVTMSLSNAGISSGNRPEIPSLLPYLCDRSDQELALDNLLKESQNKPGKPVVCLIHGNETEAHDKFLERLQKVMLPKLLPPQPERVAVQDYLLAWPENVHDETAMHGRFLRSLSDTVLGNFAGTRESVNGRLAQALGPVVIHAHTITETWDLQGIEALPMFLRFWEQWSELAIGQQLFVLLFIKYQETRNFSFFKRRKYSQLNQTLRERLEQYEFSVFPRLSAAALPELEGASQLDAENWAQGEASRFCDRSTLVEAIGDYYAEWEAHEKTGRRPVRIPTDQLAPKLKEIMSRTQLVREI
jgi:Domain of unknown function (DUF4062)/inactive STAND